MDGPPDPLVGAAPADVSAQCGVDVGIGRARCVREQSRGGHELPRLTIPALRDVLAQPRSLQMATARAGQPLDRRDVLAGGRGKRHLARSRRRAAHMNGTGSARADPTPELGPREPQCVAQYPEEWRVGRHVDGVYLPVH